MRLRLKFCVCVLSRSVLPPPPLLLLPLRSRVLQRRAAALRAAAPELPEASRARQLDPSKVVEQLTVAKGELDVVCDVVSLLELGEGMRAEHVQSRLRGPSLSRRWALRLASKKASGLTCAAALREARAKLGARCDLERRAVEGLTEAAARWAVVRGPAGALSVDLWPELGPSPTPSARAAAAERPARARQTFDPVLSGGDGVEQPSASDDLVVLASEVDTASGGGGGGSAGGGQARGVVARPWLGDPRHPRIVPLHSTADGRLACLRWREPTSGTAVSSAAPRKIELALGEDQVADELDRRQRALDWSGTATALGAAAEGRDDPWLALGATLAAEASEEALQKLKREAWFDHEKEGAKSVSVNDSPPTAAAPQFAEGLASGFPRSSDGVSMAVWAAASTAFKLRWRAAALRLLATRIPGEELAARLADWSCREAGRAAAELAARRRAAKADTVACPLRATRVGGAGELRPVAWAVPGPNPTETPTIVWVDRQGATRTGATLPQATMP